MEDAAGDNGSNCSSTSDAEECMYDEIAPAARHSSGGAADYLETAAAGLPPPLPPPRQAASFSLPRRVSLPPPLPQRTGGAASRA